ncbi:diguanylate cyclase [Bacillus sp. DJP31]|uniref:diguanylate cyclase n=1 Tax=Bacillus sp. DJP31 TaxID=3409789 RepID=UPI003BB71B21
MSSRFSLQTKIILMFAVVIVITMSVVVLFNSYTFHQAVKETYVSQLKGITTAINGRYEESRSIVDVQQILDYIKHREENILELTLHVRTEGNHIIGASTNRDLEGNVSASVLNPSLISGKTMVAHMDSERVKKVRLVAPLIEDGQATGAIELYINNTDDIAAVNHKIFLTIVVGATIGVILLILLWFIIRRLLVLPLLTLREAALSIENGGHYQLVELEASQEIKEVADAFNQMVYTLEDRLQKSITDPLTGVYNSAHFKQMLAFGMKQSKETGHAMALLFCDVDNFKKLNDHEGHLFGDKILTEISQLIAANVRSGDIVCRYGGEEFVVIMQNADEEMAKNVAERIRQKVALHGSNYILTPITISIGVAIYPDDTNEEGFVHLADQAMYAAKSLGKNRVITAKELQAMEQHNYERSVEDQKWLVNTIVSIARAVEVKDPYTHSHSEMVSRYSAKIASRLGLSEREVKNISIAGLLHDVGKIGIPDHILNKDNPLSPEEYEILKTHPVLGYNILSSVDELKDVLPYVLHHHERPDGKGYPNGLRQEEIPLGARIITVVDAYHSMTSVRPYRKKPLTEEQAIALLQKGIGTKFDKLIVEEFLSIIEEIKAQAS